MTERYLPANDLLVEAEQLSDRLQRDIFTYAASEIDPSREIGIGVDVIEVARISERAPSFFRAFFTPAERKYCETYGDYRGQPYGARWCAKEAVAKALGGIPKGNFKDVEILRDENNVPQVALYRAAKLRAEQLAIESIKVSLTHTETIAGAACIVVRKRNGTDS